MTTKTQDDLQQILEAKDKEIKRLQRERDDAYMRKAEIELELGRVRSLLNKAVRPQ